MIDSNKVVKNILGDRTSKSKKESIGKCAICGTNNAYRTHGVHVHDYGVRKYKVLPMCESCIKAEEEGVL